MVKLSKQFRDLAHELFDGLDIDIYRERIVSLNNKAKYTWGKGQLKIPFRLLLSRKLKNFLNKN